MAFKPGKRTARNIATVNEKLQELSHAVFANTPVDFCVLDGGGYRDPRQAAVYAAKGTGIAKSRHCSRMALDFVLYINGAPTWDVKKYRQEYTQLVTCILEQADILKLDVVSGIDWNCNGKWGEAGTKEWDWPHIERPYPHNRPKAAAARERRIAARRAKETLTSNLKPKPELAVVESAKKSKKKKASKKKEKATDGHC